MIKLTDSETLRIVESNYYMYGETSLEDIITAITQALLLFEEKQK